MFGIATTLAALPNNLGFFLKVSACNTFESIVMKQGEKKAQTRGGGGGCNLVMLINVRDKHLYEDVKCQQLVLIKSRREQAMRTR